MTPGALGVGSVVETTAPSGMVQRFRISEWAPPTRFAFELVESSWFRAAELSFELERQGPCTKIVHDIRVTFRFPCSVLVPVLSLVSERALGADLDLLRRALEDSLDLTRDASART